MCNIAIIVFRLAPVLQLFQNLLSSYIAMDLAIILEEAPGSNEIAVFCQGDCNLYANFFPEVQTQMEFGHNRELRNNCFHFLPDGFFERHDDVAVFTLDHPELSN